jgi:prepilin-type N-terminal cleavage/methylation domain-containing protein
MKKIIRSQKGFTLAELMVVVGISILLAGYKLYPMYLEAHSTKASAQGVQLATLGNSVATYSTQYYGQLVNGTGIPGVANIYAPTIENLKALGLLAPNFSAVNMYGSGYAVRITKSPAGCVAPNCDIENLAYLTSAITNPANGRVDGAALGQAAQMLGKNGADGGYSDTERSMECS